MKKLIICALIFLPFLAKADAGLFFFQNGTGYDLSGQLTAYCLMDGQAYDIHGVSLGSCNPIVTVSNPAPPVIVPVDLVPTLVQPEQYPQVSVNPVPTTTPDLISGSEPMLEPTIATSTPPVCIMSKAEFLQQQNDLWSAYNSNPLIVQQYASGSTLLPGVQDLMNTLSAELGVLRHQYNSLQDPSCQN